VFRQPGQRDTAPGQKWFFDRFGKSPAKIA